MAKAGRKNAYESKVKPHLDYIKKQLKNGATEKQIAESLGISFPAWCNYKRQYDDLKEVCLTARAALVEDLKGALIQRALGMKLEEKKTYIKEDEAGRKTKYTEITVKEIPPDPMSIFSALKIYDKDKLDYDIQSQNIELKRQELELKKTLAEKENF